MSEEKNHVKNEGLEPAPAKVGHYKLLFANSRAKLPAGYSAPIGVETTRGLMWVQQRRNVAAAEGRDS
jgi:hypothetical protein